MKLVKLHLKQWAFERGDPKWLKQGLIDSLQIAWRALEEDIADEEKQKLVIDKQEALKTHYEKLETDAQ